MYTLYSLIVVISIALVSITTYVTANHVCQVQAFNSPKCPVTNHLAFPSGIRKPAVLAAEMQNRRPCPTPLSHDLLFNKVHLRVMRLHVESLL